MTVHIIVNVGCYKKRIHLICNVISLVDSISLAMWNNVEKFYFTQIQLNGKISAVINCLKIIASGKNGSIQAHSYEKTKDVYNK